MRVAAAGHGLRRRE
uniref:Uncharacterized protein n=1 Tax=Arundo donax TaxID=35708 RepID=A0A0A9FWY8_ARUDO